MITRQQAYERISGLAEAEVRQLCRRRILGEDTAPVGGGYFDEPPEDLVIQLLRNGDLPAEIRQAAIGGCRDVYSAALAWLATGDQPQLHRDLIEAATRLCRVVDVAEPMELRAHADGMLSLALDLPELPSSVLPAAVRASMAFGRTPDHVALWKRVLERSEVAAYAFNALVEIDPNA